MKSIEELEKEFNQAIGHRVTDYALIKNEDLSTLYTIVNIQRKTMTLVDDLDVAKYFCERLISAGVPIYDEMTQIPGWGDFKKEVPPPLHPDLYTFIKKNNQSQI
jgi:hypothetical protein